MLPALTYSSDSGCTYAFAKCSWLGPKNGSAMNCWNFHEFSRPSGCRFWQNFGNLGIWWPFDGLSMAFDVFDGPWLAWHSWHHRVVVSTAASGPTRPSSEALNSAGGPYLCCQNLPVSQKDAESLNRLSRLYMIIHDYRALNIFDKVNVPRCHHWHCWTCHFH